MDLFDGKRIFSNTRFKNIPKKYHKNINYLDKETIPKMFEMTKNKTIDLRKSTMFIQEMHNYLDSRRAMSKKNQVLTWWINQSRHTGEGSSSIIYDTQALMQVDIRLRDRTDYILRPFINKWEGTSEKDKKPVNIDVSVDFEGKMGNFEVSCRKTRSMYDTHEIIDF